MAMFSLVLSLAAAVAIPFVAVELDCRRHRHTGGWIRPKDFLGTVIFFMALMGCFGWLVWRAEWRSAFGWKGGYGALTLILSAFILHFYHKRRTRRR